MDVIILAGGQGSRLKSIVSEVPKPLAPIVDHPFLYFLMNHLAIQGAQRFIISTGYRGEMIQHYFGKTFQGIPISYAHESSSLGTGGALANSLAFTSPDRPLIVTNGDSYSEMNVESLLVTHRNNHNDITLGLKPMSHFSRYGSVAIDSAGRIIEFKEKQPQTYGLINIGIYALTPQKIASRLPNAPFSFESFLEDNIKRLVIGSMLTNDYFIDIGIPEDYEAAQRFFSQDSQSSQLSKIYPHTSHKLTIRNNPS